MATLPLMSQPLPCCREGPWTDTARPSALVTSCSLAPTSLAPLRRRAASFPSACFSLPASVPAPRHSRRRRARAASAASSPQVMEAPADVSISSDASNSDSPTTLLSFVLAPSSGATADLAVVVSQVAVAAKRISGAAARLGIVAGLQGQAKGGGRNQSGDEQKALDVVSDEMMMSALRDSRRVSVAASEESDEVVLIPEAHLAPAPAQHYAVVFDPLDGSRNIDAGIPTGTIFGVYPAASHPSAAAALQPGRALVCAGYALYSSATVLVLSLGKGVHGFTLDPVLGEFLLTHPGLQIPKRGQIYSVNDARYFDWSQGLRNYIDDVRQGKGQTKKKYSARYICSLVGDFHRTLLYGGVAMNPRSHLRLVYEANPLSFIAEQAGGKGWNGRERILDLQPTKLHERLPLFLGSPDDIDEMATYEDVRQDVNPGYDV